MVKAPADLLEREKSWDPQIFCGPMLSLLRMRELGTSSAEAAVVLEGWRGLPEAGRAGPVYRASNVGELELRLEFDHCSTPVQTDERCVRPGDVVVAKGLPIRAAFAPTGVFRHAVDANCFLIRGLDLAVGLWFALCLNQPMFSDYLVRKSGAAIVPRLRRDVLATSRFPKSSAGFELLSQNVASCLERRFASDVEFLRFRSVVRNEVAGRVPDVDTVDRPLRYDSTGWSNFFSPVAIDDSLVPEHVSVSGRQQHLYREAGWFPIRDLLSSRKAGGERLGKADQRIRTLQLSDIGDDLIIRRGQVRGWETSSRRVFAEPVRENEILLSALVSRPRVAFAGFRPDLAVHPTDHWHRLRFRETPGAWALVLSTPEIHQQLQRLAIGTVQQFAPTRSIQRLVLPDIPLEIRIKWDSFLRRWQQRRRELDDEWTELMRQCYRYLRETHHSCGPWTRPPAIIRDLGERE